MFGVAGGLSFPLQVPDGKGGWMWPKLPTPTGDGTILLFYGYVTPEWTRTEQDAAIDFAYGSFDIIMVD